MIDNSLLQAVAAAVQVPPHRYEVATRSYRSVARWLAREESSLHHARPTVYVQGSFSLGTAILPVTDKEEYDVDLVCELSLSTMQISQADLKHRLGRELLNYTQRHGMNAPREKNRCWTLQYADDAQYHLDILPAIPDYIAQVLREALGGQLPPNILITDRTHPDYRRRVSSWSHSNPKGYSMWFEGRKAQVYLWRDTSTEDIPTYGAISPLVQTIQILKRHRDIMFRHDQTVKPVSIIVTTLAAHAYGGEPTLSTALTNILCNMAEYIETRDGVTHVANPVDQQENFADKWQKHPERQHAFYTWLGRAQGDFVNIQGLSFGAALNYLGRVLGSPAIDRAATSTRSRA